MTQNRLSSARPDSCAVQPTIDNHTDDAATSGVDPRGAGISRITSLAIPQNITGDIFGRAFDVARIASLVADEHFTSRAPEPWPTSMHFSRRTWSMRSACTLPLLPASVILQRPAAPSVCAAERNSLSGNQTTGGNVAIATSLGCARGDRHGRMRSAGRPGWPPLANFDLSSPPPRAVRFCVAKEYPGMNGIGAFGQPNVTPAVSRGHPGADDFVEPTSRLHEQ